MRTTSAQLHHWLMAGDDSGQATTEYALVMLGAALVALLVVGWATGGGGAGKIGHLFDRVIDAVTGKL
jgi:Flp pilus assembly pilin Flp